jgi:hypothetical protein
MTDKINDFADLETATEQVQDAMFLLIKKIVLSL